jgi:hypothetical protein
MAVRLIVGYVLAAGILSLLVSQGLPPSSQGVNEDPRATGRELSGEAWYDPPSPPHDQRRTSMDPQDRSTTVFDGPEIRTAAGVASASPAPSLVSRPGERPPTGDAGVSVSTMIGQGLRQAEDVIHQYPWPTLLIGVGVGFFLARRVR